MIDDGRGQYYEIADSGTGQKVNWDGEVVPDGPWLEKTLLTIGDAEITNEHVVVGSGVLIAVIILAVLACFLVSWWKRKYIAT